MLQGLLRGYRGLQGIIGGHGGLQGVANSLVPFTFK